jgi:hypothetical protein
MSVKGKLRRGRRRFVCALRGHDWAPWEPSPLPGDAQEYRECQRCPKMEWRPK